MKQFAHLLLAATLLAAPACSKKEYEYVAPASTPSTGAYVIDGRTVTASTAATVQSGNGGDQLTITLYTGTSGQEQLRLVYNKPAGAPESAYDASVLLTDVGYGTEDYAEQRTMTLTKTAGGYSGRFDATRPARPGVAASQIKGGQFTNVR